MWMLKEQVADWFVTGLLALGQTLLLSNAGSDQVLYLKIVSRIWEREGQYRKVEIEEPENNSLPPQGHLSF